MRQPTPLRLVPQVAAPPRRVIHDTESRWSRRLARGAARLARAARIVWLRLELWDLDRYLAECATDGLDQSLALTEFNRQRDDIEGRLIVLRAGHWA